MSLFGAARLIGGAVDAVVAHENGGAACRNDMHDDWRASAVVTGTARTLTPEMRDMVEARLRERHASELARLMIDLRIHVWRGSLVLDSCHRREKASGGRVNGRLTILSG